MYIEPITVQMETETAVKMLLWNASLGGYTDVWLPKSQVALDNDRVTAVADWLAMRHRLKPR